MGTYRQIYERSLEQPEAFWAEAAEALHWDRRWDRVLDADKAPFYRWFAGGALNTCFNAVDRHVASGRGGQPAIIHDSPVTGTKRVITYAELRDQVARFAGALVAPRRAQGRPGHRLHADGARGARRHAGLRPDRRRPLGRLRRLRLAGAGDPHRRRQAEGRRLRLLRHRGRPLHPLQAAARQGARTRQPRGGPLRRPPAPAGRRRAPARPRPRLAGGRCRRPPGRLRAGRRHRPALHPLHLGHDRPAQGRGAGQWRPRRRPRSGPCATSTASSPARCSGPRPTSAGSSATATSSTGRS